MKLEDRLIVQYKELDWRLWELEHPPLYSVGQKGLIEYHKIEDNIIIISVKHEKIPSSNLDLTTKHIWIYEIWLIDERSKITLYEHELKFIHLY